MTSDQKLGRMVRVLIDAGVDVLVMGGHAVRYYGIDRNTVDFDLVTSLATPDELRARLPTIAHFQGIREEPVWRHRDFARFEVGQLPDGREEWLEFWIRNHLLPDFASLKARAELGSYGGEQIPFLSIADLMRSKETERESDWQDISLLEEIQDARNASGLKANKIEPVQLLARLRSRRGMDKVLETKLCQDRIVIAAAIANCTHPATYAFLIPLAPDATPARLPILVDPTMLAALRTITFGSPKHFALVEICRRAYKRHAMDIDRADKQASLKQN